MIRPPSKSTLFPYTTLFRSPASLTKMEHVTRGGVRLLFVIDASQPPPATLSVTRLLPAAGHQLQSPAAGVQAPAPTFLIPSVPYLPRKATYPATQVPRCRS